LAWNFIYWQYKCSSADSMHMFYRGNSYLPCISLNINYIENVSNNIYGYLNEIFILFHLPDFCSLLTSCKIRVILGWWGWK